MTRKRQAISKERQLRTSFSSFELCKENVKRFHVEKRLNMINDSYNGRNESQSDNLRYPETIVIITCGLNAPLIFISIAGNALVLAAILRTPSLHSPSSVFLCFLAVSDLLVGFVTQPLYIANELKLNPSLHGAIFALTTLTCGVSLGIMAAISVDRFIALHYHMRYASLMTPKRAMYTSVTLWLVAILLSCLSYWKDSVFLLVNAVAIAICIVITTFSYIQIYRIVRQHQIQIRTQQQAVQTLNTGGDINMMRLKKSAMNTFIYFMCMIMFYIPLLISMLIMAIYPNQWTKTWNFADTVCFMNSSINPFLYCWRLSELRAAILKIIRNMLCKHSDEN